MKGQLQIDLTIFTRLQVILFYFSKSLESSEELLTNKHNSRNESFYMENSLASFLQFIFMIRSKVHQLVLHIRIHSAQQIEQQVFNNQVTWNTVHQ